MSPLTPPASGAIKGFLTGKIDAQTTFAPSDFRNIVPRFTPDNRKANQAMVELLTRIAGQKQATPAQIALAWLFAQKPWIVPIPGTTKLARFEENLGAVDVQLTPEDLREIERAAANITVQGTRYPKHLQQTRRPLSRLGDARRDRPRPARRDRDEDRHGEHRQAARRGVGAVGRPLWRW